MALTRMILTPSSLTKGDIMAKRFFALMLAALMLLTLAGCGETKTLHCDHCGGEILVEADSNMEEDWIVYCGPCNEALFGGTLVE